MGSATNKLVRIALRDTMGHQQKVLLVDARVAEHTTLAEIAVALRERTTELVVEEQPDDPYGPQVRRLPTKPRKARQAQKENA